MDKVIVKRRATELSAINAGIALIAAGVHVFKTPNRFAVGGVSGVAVVLKYFFPTMSVGAIIFSVNAALLVAAFAVLGLETAVKSIYGSLALSGFIMALEWLFPISKPLTDQRLMELLYGVFLPGVGMALVFRYGATTGGTDIVAQILSKYFKTKVSVSLLIADVGVVAAAGLCFGAETCLFSLLGVVIKAFVLDAFMESFEVYKIIVIISEKSETIKEYIRDSLDRGATVSTARGAFNSDEKEVITTVLSRRQAKRLQSFVKSVDERAFLTISNSSRIIGNGFGGFE